MQTKLDILFSGLDKLFVGGGDLPLVQRDISLDGDGKVCDINVESLGHEPLTPLNFTNHSCPPVLWREASLIFTNISTNENTAAVASPTLGGPALAAKEVRILESGS